MQTEGLVGSPNPTGMGPRDGAPGSRVGVAELLERVLELGASDLHLTAGARPTVRVHGRLGQLEDFPVLLPAETQAMIYSILTQRQRERLEREQELDCAHALPGKARFRLNVYFQRDSVGAAFRLIPQEIKPLEALGIPAQVSGLARLPRGFVLVTGPTGSGKSTTLASMVDLANREREDHIMTVEDPIEFLHRHKRCLVNQREVGEDTKSFASALKHVLRQDPDIILVGELRDLETISIALTAAETGHLVFATLHTQDAPQTVDRVIDVFPTNQQQQIRVQLAGALQGVVCQQLVPTAILIAIAIPTFLGARQRAQNRAAQSSLRNALTAAKTIYTDTQSYTGATAAAMEAVEPSLNYVATAAASGNQNTVSVNNSAAGVFAAAAMSASGTCYWIKEDVAAGTTYGSTTTAADCTGDDAAGAAAATW
jgi:twitching motility protein PilT